MVKTNSGDYVISENELRLLLGLSFEEGVKSSDRYRYDEQFYISDDKEDIVSKLILEFR